MSTRSIIARGTSAEDFEGQYHHYDGYPEAMGPTLRKMYEQGWPGELEKMFRFIVDEHPAGWSNLHGVDDWSGPVRVGFASHGTDSANTAQCFCHGCRKEDGSGVMTTTKNSGCEYLYLVDPKTANMQIYDLHSYAPLLIWEGPLDSYPDEENA